MIIYPKNSWMFKKEWTQKQKALDFYNAYEGQKVQWQTFYYRVRLGWEETWEDKIKPRERTYNRKTTAPTGKRAKEMTRYNEQPEPKASKNLFRNRLNSNYPKEQAILMGEKWDAVKRWQSKQSYPAKVYVPKKIVVKEPDERDFRIEVTLSKEEARVFRKEYINMIEQTEWELTYTEEKTQVSELNERLTRLKWELEIFNLYNKR